MKEMIEQLKKELLEELLKEFRGSQSSEAIEEPEKKEVFQTGMIRARKKPKETIEREPTSKEVVEDFLRRDQIEKAISYLNQRFNCYLEKIDYEKFLVNDWEGWYDGCTNSGTEAAKYVEDRRDVLFSFGLTKRKETRERDYEEYSFSHNYYEVTGESEIVIIIFKQQIKSNFEESGNKIKAFWLDMTEENWFNRMYGER